MSWTLLWSVTKQSTILQYFRHSQFSELSCKYFLKCVASENIHTSPRNGSSVHIFPLTSPPPPNPHPSWNFHFCNILFLKKFGFWDHLPKGNYFTGTTPGRKFVLIRSYISFKAQPKVSPWAYLLIGHAYGGEYLYEILGGILGFWTVFFHDNVHVINWNYIL